MRADKPLRIDKDLVAACATPLVLGILADGAAHGYAILKRVGELSEGRMQWTDGMLYPLLHRLERNGWVTAEWSLSDTGRKRKHYVLTPAGRTELETRRAQWSVVAETLGKVWARVADALRVPVDAPRILARALVTALRAPAQVPSSTAGAWA